MAWPCEEGSGRWHYLGAASAEEDSKDWISILRLFVLPVWCDSLKGELVFTGLRSRHPIVPMQSGGCRQRGKESKASQQAAPAAAPCQQWHLAGRQSKRLGEVGGVPPPATGAAQRGAVRGLRAQILPPQASSDSGKGKKDRGRFFPLSQSRRCKCTPKSL